MDRNGEDTTAQHTTVATAGRAAAENLTKSAPAIKICITALGQWADTWAAPWLTKDVKINFSSRLTRSLGRCKPYSKDITLNIDLLKLARSELLLEVLCHEAAHIVNHVKHGRLVKAHGLEWQALVVAVGFQPKRVITVKESETISSNENGNVLYEHRCPVCQNVRYSGRPIKRWKCGLCLASGLSGELIIIKHRRISGE